MKKLYIFTLILYSTSIYSQDLLGVWYLNYRIYNGVENNFHHTEEDALSIIEFMYSGESDFYSYLGSDPCGAFSGDFEFVDDQTIILPVLYQTLGDCANSDFEVDFKMDEYYALLMNGDDFTIPSQLNVSILENDGNQTLTLTNENGDIAVYNSLPFIDERLLSVEWQLQAMNSNDMVYNNNSNQNFLINFNTLQEAEGYYQIQGTLICNSFFGEYYIYQRGIVEFGNQGTTLVFCDTVEEDILENTFLQLIANNNFEYTIGSTGEENVLTITDPDTGNYAIFNRQTLSLEDFTKTKISLEFNLVNDVLSLKIPNHIDRNSTLFEIFDIQGAKILFGNLNSELVDVKNFSEGLYFLNFINSQGEQQVLKFIKK